MRVQLSGYVMDTETANIYRKYGYTGVCCPGDIREALDKCKKEEDLIFEINSRGGSVYDGFEMYTALRNAGRETIGEIGSIAASAASIIAIGCTKLRISPVGNMMIHRASCSVSGNAEDMAQMKQMLDTIDRSILTAYTERAGEKCTEEKFLQMMKDETFLAADEAIAMGLADEKMFQEETTGEAMARAAVAMAGGMKKAMAELPDINELKRRSGEEDSTGRPENKKEEKHMELNELERDHPELVRQIENRAAEQERQRIAQIDEIAMAGFEDLVEAAKKDPNKTAATVAIEIVNRQKQQGSDFLKNREKDAEDGNVNGVKPEAMSEGNEDDDLKRVLAEAFGEA